MNKANQHQDATYKSHFGCALVSILFHDISLNVINVTYAQCIYDDKVMAFWISTVPVATCLMAAILPIARAMMSKIVDKDEQGRLQF